MTDIPVNGTHVHYPFYGTYGGNNQNHCNDNYAHLALSNKISDGTEKISTDVCNLGHHVANGNLHLSTRISEGVEKVSGDVCALSNENSNQHMLLSNRLSDVGEKNLTATLNTGREVVKDIGDSSRYLGGAVHDVDRNVLKAGCDNTNAIISSTSALGFNIRDAIERSIVASEKSNAENRLATANASAEGRLTSQQNTNEVRTAVERNNTNILLTGKDLGLEICHAKGDIQTQACDNTRVLERQAADNKAQLEKQVYLVDRNVTESKCSIERQAAEYKASVEHNILMSKCTLERQAAENKASIELEALKNKEALARQMAECCCEVKEKIEQRFCETNQLIREIDSNRIRDQLNDAKQENLFLKFQQQQCVLGGSGK